MQLTIVHIHLAAVQTEAHIVATGCQRAVLHGGVQGVLQLRLGLFALRALRFALAFLWDNRE